MSLPQMNPLTAKLMGGKDYREQLKKQLLDAAAKTDDPAYSKRLTEVANGTRPLRTLMSDPAFLAEKGMTKANEQKFEQALADIKPPEGTFEEARAQAQADLEAQGIKLPSVEEAAALFDEVMHLARQTESTIAAERLTGWGGSEERLAQQEAAEAAEAAQTHPKQDKGPKQG